MAPWWGCTVERARSSLEAVRLGASSAKTVVGAGLRGRFRRHRRRSVLVGAGIVAVLAQPLVAAVGPAAALAAGVQAERPCRWIPMVAASGDTTERRTRAFDASLPTFFSSARHGRRCQHTCNGQRAKLKIPRDRGMCVVLAPAPNTRWHHKLIDLRNAVQLLLPFGHVAHRDARDDGTRHSLGHELVEAVRRDTVRLCF